MGGGESKEEEGNNDSEYDRSDAQKVVQGNARAMQYPGTKRPPSGGGFGGGSRADADSRDYDDDDDGGGFATGGRSFAPNYGGGGGPGGSASGGPSSPGMLGGNKQAQFLTDSQFQQGVGAGGFTGEGIPQDSNRYFAASGLPEEAYRNSGKTRRVVRSRTAVSSCADRRLRSAIEDVDAAVDAIEKESMRLCESGMASKGSGGEAGSYEARIDPVSQKMKLENLMTKRDALLTQKRELVEERMNIRALISHDFEILQNALQSSRKAARAGASSPLLADEVPHPFLQDRVGGLSPMEAHLARMIPSGRDGQGQHPSRTPAQKHAFNRAKIDYYKGQLRGGEDLLHSVSGTGAANAGGINLVDFLEEPDPVEIEEAISLEKEAELKQRADHLQAVVREKNELIKRMIEKNEQQVGGGQANVGGSGAAGVGARNNLVSQKTLHDIADHSVEKMIQTHWRDKVEEATEKEFQDLKEQLNQVREQHADEKFRTMLQELQDLRCDPSLQVYYDAPTVSLDVAMEREAARRDAGGGVIEGGSEVLSRGYLQADYLNEDTIKGNIRTILAEGVYSALGVHREPGGDVVADAVSRPRTNSPLISPKVKTRPEREVEDRALKNAYNQGMLAGQQQVLAFGGGGAARGPIGGQEDLMTPGLTPMLDGDGRALHDTELPPGYLDLFAQGVVGQGPLDKKPPDAKAGDNSYQPAPNTSTAGTSSSATGTGGGAGAASGVKKKSLPSSLDITSDGEGGGGGGGAGKRNVVSLSLSDISGSMSSDDGPADPGSFGSKLQSVRQSEPGVRASKPSVPGSSLPKLAAADSSDYDDSDDDSDTGGGAKSFYPESGLYDDDGEEDDGGGAVSVPAAEKIMIRGSSRSGRSSGDRSAGNKMKEQKKMKKDELLDHDRHRKKRKTEITAAEHTAQKDTLAQSQQTGAMRSRSASRTKKQKKKAVVVVSPPEESSPGSRQNFVFYPEGGRSAHNAELSNPLAELVQAPLPAEAEHLLGDMDLLRLHAKKPSATDLADGLLKGHNAFGDLVSNALDPASSPDGQPPEAAEAIESVLANLQKKAAREKAMGEGGPDDSFLGMLYSPTLHKSEKEKQEEKRKLALKRRLREDREEDGGSSDGDYMADEGDIAGGLPTERTFTKKSRKNRKGEFRKGKREIFSMDEEMDLAKAHQRMVREVLHRSGRINYDKVGLWLSQIRKDVIKHTLVQPYSGNLRYLMPYAPAVKSGDVAPLLTELVNEASRTGEKYYEQCSKQLFQDEQAVVQAFKEKFGAEFDLDGKNANIGGSSGREDLVDAAANLDAVEKARREKKANEVEEREPRFINQHGADYYAFKPVAVMRLASAFQLSLRSALRNAYTQNKLHILRGTIKNVMVVIGEEVAALIIEAKLVEDVVKEVRDRFGAAPAANANIEAFNYDLHAANLVLSTLLVLGRHECQLYFEEHIANLAGDPGNVGEIMHLLMETPVYTTTVVKARARDEMFVDARRGQNQKLGGGSSTNGARVDERPRPRGAGGDSNISPPTMGLLPSTCCGVDLIRVWKHLVSLFDLGDHQLRLYRGFRAQRHVPVVPGSNELNSLLEKVEAACAASANIGAANILKRKQTANNTYFSMMRDNLTALRQRLLVPQANSIESLTALPLHIKLDLQFSMQNGLLFARMLESQLEALHPEMMPQFLGLGVTGDGRDGGTGVAAPPPKTVSSVFPSMQEPGSYVSGQPPLVTDVGALEYAAKPGTIAHGGAQRHKENARITEDMSPNRLLHYSSKKCIRRVPQDPTISRLATGRAATQKSEAQKFQSDFFQTGDGRMRYFNPQDLFGVQIPSWRGMTPREQLLLEEADLMPGAGAHAERIILDPGLPLPETTGGLNAGKKLGEKLAGPREKEQEAAEDLHLDLLTETFEQHVAHEPHLSYSPEERRELKMRALLREWNEEKPEFEAHAMTAGTVSSPYSSRYKMLMQKVEAAESGKLDEKKLQAALFLTNPKKYNPPSRAGELDENKRQREAVRRMKEQKRAGTTFTDAYRDPAKLASARQSIRKSAAGSTSPASRNGLKSQRSKFGERGREGNDAYDDAEDHSITQSIQMPISVLPRDDLHSRPASQFGGLASVVTYYPEQGAVAEDGDGRKGRGRGRDQHLQLAPATTSSPKDLLAAPVLVERSSSGANANALAVSTTPGAAGGKNSVSGSTGSTVPLAFAGGMNEPRHSSPLRGKKIQVRDRI
eukprot:g18915.t1